MSKQTKKIELYMQDGNKWHTLGEISNATGSSEVAVLASLRNLRKVEWGCYEMLKRRRGGTGFFEYNMVK